MNDFINPRRETVNMRHLGFLMQLAALTLLPAVVVWQLTFGIPLLIMPLVTLIAILLFTVGHMFRERK